MHEVKQWLAPGLIFVTLLILSQVDSQESSRQQRRAEILERLMSLYSGVVCIMSCLIMLKPHP